MDRKIQPEIQTLKNFRILPPVRMTLPNGIPLTVINAGEQEVVRIDVLFAGARWQQSQKLQALFTNRMLPLPRNWITTVRGSNCPARRSMHTSLFIR